MAGPCQCGCGQLARRLYLRGHHRRGRSLTPEHRAAIARAQTGKVVSAETRAKISALHLGRPRTAAERKAISLGMKGKAAVGERHANWKGSDVSYSALHNWVAWHKKKTGTCSSCSAQVGVDKWTGTEWANVSGRYLRDLDDYRELCKPCHRRHDWHRHRPIVEKPV